MLLNTDNNTIKWINRLTTSYKHLKQSGFSSHPVHTLFSFSLGSEIFEGRHLLSESSLLDGLASVEAAFTGADLTQHRFLLHPLLAPFCVAQFSLDLKPGLHTETSRYHVSTIVLCMTRCFHIMTLVAPSGECLRGNGPPDRIVSSTWCHLFLAAYPSGLNLVVAVLRDSVYVIAALRGRLLSVVYIVRKVEQFVSIILNEDYYYYYY